MMKFKLRALLFFISSIMFSQGSFSHSVGIGGYFGTRKAYSQAVGIMYSPRYNFLKVSENSTLSIGTHFGLAHHVSNRADLGLSYHIPIVLEYNFGHASDKTKYANKSGGFIGLGYSMDSTHVYETFTDFFGFHEYTEEVTIKGPVVNLGLRFKLFGKSAGIKLSYLYGTGNLKSAYMSSLGFQYNIGVK